MIKTIIVENEPKQVDILMKMLSSQHPDVSVVAVCLTVLDAVEKINLLQPDLVFMDINLDVKAGGFEVIKFTKSIPYKVIFTTAYGDYALIAIRLSAIDFLLKPFDKEDLNEALQKYDINKATASSENLEVLMHNMIQRDFSRQLVGIPILTGWHFVPIADIILCKADNTCTEYNLINNKKLKATRTLKWVEELMRDHDFYRIHESYLINLSHIKKYRKEGDIGVVEMTEDLEADVARRRINGFIKKLKERGMIL